MTDGDLPIPMDQGTEEGWRILQDRLDQMSNETLMGVWEVLSYYDPKAYYDEKHQIGMDGYASAIERELSKRKLPIPY